MKIYLPNEKKPSYMLRNALRLPQQPKLTVSIVGAGGKTTLLYALAEEYAALGKRVIVTTTTHIFRPDDRHTVIGEKAQAVIDAVLQLESAEAARGNSSGRIAVAGRDAGNGKLQGMELAELLQLCRFADLLLIEADGAKRMPLKAPAEHEPVILETTDAVIACVGLDCIGQTFLQACFRPERALELLSQNKMLSGLKEDDCIRPEHVAALLASPDGGKKGVCGREFRMVLNKADQAGRVLAGRRVMEHLPDELRGNCIMTSFWNETGGNR